MVDGDEICLKLSECGCRVNMASVLADSCFAASSTSRTEIVDKYQEMRR